METGMLLYSKLWWDIRDSSELLIKRATMKLVRYLLWLENHDKRTTTPLDTANNNVLPIIPRLLRNLYQLPYYPGSPTYNTATLVEGLKWVIEGKMRRC